MFKHCINRAKKNFWLEFFFVLFICLSRGIGAYAQQGDFLQLKKIRASLYKIRVVSQTVDFRQPWNHSQARKGTGSGFYIGKNRILSNAHVVANARFITVQRDGDPVASPAFVTYIAHDCDLAILTVADKKYFKNVPSLGFGAVPKLRTPVATVGFPTGGEQISVTEGIVSRIEYRRYVHPYNFNHLMVQVDSAINSGNSGGPVLQAEKVVGVAFQSYTAAENTGYIIPTPIIRRFLVDIEDGIYDGHIASGLKFKRFVMLNRGTAEYHGMRQGGRGVKISYVEKWSPFFRRLHQGDILLEIDKKDIGVDGSISYLGERVSFLAWIDLKQKNQKVEFKIVRNNQEKILQVLLQNPGKHPEKGYLYTKQVPFLIVGGIVITSLSRSFLRSYGSQWYHSSPVLYKYVFYHGSFDENFSEKEEFILISGILPHKVNRYIQLPGNALIKKVQGTKISTLQQVHELISKNRKEYLSIELEGINEPLVLSQKELDEAERDIAKIYNISSFSWLGDLQDGAINNG